ncbi:dihydropteroate synthase [Galbibacter orientalis]|uniref:Dihydropteroate synthase n=1 Tax=Galbibacter orientalis DSM 19592 TaxID=926559 RepID=I3C7R7_9FLAO|nr:dihydropteroate synthase [Galbibacter orientalis]EIJ39660.1 dihydropteroate synthase [Galbibacter orientalis DSM 19592]
MTINCNGTLIDISSPKVMGILNTTPDSFFDGGKYTNDSHILNRVESMLNDGATFIDLGAYSSRPGAKEVSVQEELKRSVPTTELILKNFPETLLSIDTFRAEVAKEAIEAGACIVNDISGGTLDPNMIPTVGKLRVPYILMHMKGNPETMQTKITYRNFMRELLYYFSERIAEANAHKINDVIIDPGFGFAKNLDQNYELMAKLDVLHILGLPLLVGISRKSMIYKLLETDASQALNGTTSLNTIALSKGANILRVHDVKEAMECIKIKEMIAKNNFSI